MITTPSGLQYEDTVVGSGAVAQAGQRVSVHYTGWLYNDGQQGAKFDSSKDRGQPFRFQLGGGEVIRGWDDGVQGMKVGGTRKHVMTYLAEFLFAPQRANAPIKTLGLHTVPVVLHPEVAVKVTVNVARSAEEAERRVLILENPGLPGSSAVTTSLYAGLQLILPKVED